MTDWNSELEWLRGAYAESTIAATETTLASFPMAKPRAVRSCRPATRSSLPMDPHISRLKLRR
jgi:hypothetical protein